MRSTLESVCIAWLFHELTPEVASIRSLAYAAYPPQDLAQFGLVFLVIEGIIRVI
jgi:hypothetical protein